MVTLIRPVLELGLQPGQPEVAYPGAARTLSREPTVSAPGTVSEASVILPGYVLPDDSREDSVHEGS